MKLGDLINLIPSGILDHVRVYMDNCKVKLIDEIVKKYNVVVIAPSLHCESSKCKCIYDCYIDIYISKPSDDELPF